MEPKSLDDFGTDIIDSIMDHLEFLDIYLIVSHLSKRFNDHVESFVYNYIYVGSYKYKISEKRQYLSEQMKILKTNQIKFTNIHLLEKDWKIIKNMDIRTGIGFFKCNMNEDIKYIPKSINLFIMVDCINVNLTKVIN